MFKLVVKLTALVLIVLGVSMFLSSGKVHAATGCPNPDTFQNAQNNLHWGVSPTYNGTHGGNMAGMLVHAYDASTNQNVDVAYTVHSGTSATNPNWGTVNGQQTNLNDRIFQDVNGNFSNRVNTFPTATNGGIFNASEKGIVTCHGWDAFGPLDLSSNDSGGNGYVLDCGPEADPTHFWFSNLSNPANDGPNGQDGYWSIQIVSPNQTVDINHYTEGSMGFYSNHFTVTNGSNTFVNLAWHPKPQQQQPSANCSIIDEYNYGNYTTVNNAGVTIHHPTRTHVTTSNPGAINNDTGGPISAYAPGSGGSLNKANQIWHITATAASFTYYTTREYQQTNGNWSFIDNNGNPSGSPSTNAHTISNCYHATCNNVPNQSIGVKGDGPNDIVVAGHQYTVSVPVRNDNSDSNAEPIPQRAGSYSFSLTEPPDDRQGGFEEHDVGTYLNVGDSTTISMTFTAPSDIRNFTLSFYPDLYGSGTIGDGCSISFPVYQHFNASVDNPRADLLPTDENPDTVNYSTKIDLSPSSPQVFIPTTSIFCKQPAAATTQQTCNQPPSAGQQDLAAHSGGTYPDEAVWSGTYNVPSGFIAGDHYCTSVSAAYTSGYIGPGGSHDVVGATGSTSLSSCDKVTNKPYFKVYGTGTSAGVALRKDDGTCTTNSGGLLAGWNNNSDNQERGAGSQLSALALVKITGFASAQAGIGNAGTDAAKLTFANTGGPNKGGGSITGGGSVAGGVSVTIDSESPDLGGSFSPSGYCINNISPPSANPNSQTLPANSSYGGASNITDNRSVFVNGDVTITGNVTYGTGWDKDHAPSFVLHATGNIKIAPNVTELDGLYVSDQNIYTCGGVTTNFYNACNNQLLVHGSFVANQVKLQRTFGSLRDEEPNPGTPGATLGLLWSHGGVASPLPSSGYRCTSTDEGSDPDTWYDNYICVPNSSSLHLAWTSWENSPDMTGSSGSTLNINHLKALGYKYCTKWNVPEEPSGHTWYDNWLCMDQARPDGSALLQFSASGSGSSTTAGLNQDCTRINEDADHDGQWQSGYFLCAPANPGTGPTAKGPPFNNCSNAGAQPAALQKRTCAAEVFELSPELYLSAPSINGGTPKWDAVTSLPPVL